MTHRRVVSWRVVRRALEARGVGIGTRGSEARLQRRNPDGTFETYILQHECCRSPSAIVWATHLRRIVWKFGLTEDDLS